MKSYIDATYNQHYAQGSFQATEIIWDSGHGEGFIAGNIIKYAMRYGKKGDNLGTFSNLCIIAMYSRCVDDWEEKRVGTVRAAKHEKLSNENIAKVVSLLSGDSPITERSL